MSSDRYNYILVEMPDNLNHDIIDELKSRAESITISQAKNINQIINLDIKEVFQEHLREEDLFEIADEDLKIKKAVQAFLVESINKVLVPRIYIKKRSSALASTCEFSYIDIDEKTYAIAGQNISYYTPRLNLGYKYVAAISYSGILEERVESS